MPKKGTPEYDAWKLKFNEKIAALKAANGGKLPRKQGTPRAKTQEDVPVKPEERHTPAAQPVAA